MLQCSNLDRYVSGQTVIDTPQVNSLILLPVTVLEGGKTNRTVVKVIYDKAT